MPTAVFYSLSTVCQYLSLYHLFVMCHYVHCCLLQSVYCLSIPLTVPPVCSMLLCPLLSSTVCKLSVNTSHCTTCLFCVSMSTAVFYSLFTDCQSLTLHHLCVVCHYVHCCLLQSVYCLSIPLTVPPVCSVSLCPLLSSTVCPLSFRTSHWTTCLFWDTMTTNVFYSLPSDFQYLTLHHLFVLLSLYPLLSSKVCLLSFNSSHCTTCLFWDTMPTTVFYSLSSVFQYFTLHHLFDLSHYGHYCLLQSVLCLSVPHTVPTVCFESLCPLQSSTVCPLSFSISHWTTCLVWVTMPTAVFYILSSVFQ